MDPHLIAPKTSVEHLLCARPCLGTRDGKGRQSLGLKKLIVYWGVVWRERVTGEGKIIIILRGKGCGRGWCRNHGSSENIFCLIFNQGSWPAEGMRSWVRWRDRLPPRSHSPATSSPTSRGGQWDKREGGRAQPLKKLHCHWGHDINWLKLIRPEMEDDVTSNNP